VVLLLRSSILLWRWIYYNLWSLSL